MAVRHGCLLIKAGLLAMSKIHANGTQPEAQQPCKVTDLAQALLPSLEPLLQLRTSHLPTGEHVRVQQGDKLARCHWDGATGDWQFVEEQAYPSAPACTAMGLIWQQARLMASQNSGGSDVKLHCLVKYAIPNVSSYPASPVHYSEEQGCRESQVQLAVQLLNLPQQSVEASGVGVVSLRGWTSPPPGQHNNTGSEIDWSDNREPSPTRERQPRTLHGLQVLAHTAGMYLETAVLSVEPNTGDPCAAIAFVSVKLPPKMIQPRHGGQSHPCLQLLTLELWSAELLISSSTAVVAPPCTRQADHAGMPASTYLHPCSWWGSNPATVTAAVAELNNSMELHSRQDMADEGCKDFMHDLSIWLAGVRSISQCVGACVIRDCLGTEPTRLTTPSLDAHQLLLVGSDLASYASSTGLTKLHQMLKQQLQFVKACTYFPTAVTAHSQQSWIGTAVQKCKAVFCMLYVSANGLPCELCESIYRKKLSRQLAGIQALYAGLMITIGTMAFSQALKDSEIGYILQFCLWLPWWYATGIHHVRNSFRGELVFSNAVAGAQLAWAFNWTLMGLRIMDLPNHVIKTHTSIVTIPRDLMVTFGQQLLASAVLPAKYLTASSVVVCACIISLNLGFGPCYVAALLNIILTVVTRLVADIQLRRLLLAPTALSHPAGKRASMMH